MPSYAYIIVPHLRSYYLVIVVSILLFLIVFPLNEVVPLDYPDARQTLVTRASTRLLMRQVGSFWNAQAR